MIVFFDFKSLKGLFNWDNNTVKQGVVYYNLPLDQIVLPLPNVWNDLESQSDVDRDTMQNINQETDNNGIR